MSTELTATGEKLIGKSPSAVFRAGTTFNGTTKRSIVTTKGLNPQVASCSTHITAGCYLHLGCPHSHAAVRPPLLSTEKDYPTISAL